MEIGIVKKTLTFFGILGAMIFCLSAVSYANQGITYRNVKAIGMGDARVAGGIGYNGFVDNPALLSRVNGVTFSVVNLPVYANKNIQDLANFINDNKDSFENFDTLTPDEKDKFIKDLEPFDGKWGRLNASPLVDIGVNQGGMGIGLAVFMTGDAAFKVDRGIYEPRVWGQGEANTAVVLGFSRPLTMLYPGLKVGVNLKYLQRRTAPLFQIKATDLGNMEEIMEPIIDDANKNKSSHFGIDVGTLWSVPLISSEVGATLRDIGFGRNNALDLGIAKRFYKDRITLLADYRDFFNLNGENIFKKIHIGGEFDLDLLALRVGINSGYPTAGIGLNFKVLQIDAAYFEDELSGTPGSDGDRRGAVQIRLGW
jgi:hypothetical protein